MCFKLIKLLYCSTLRIESVLYRKCFQEQENLEGSYKDRKKQSKSKLIMISNSHNNLQTINFYSNLIDIKVDTPLINIVNSSTL